MIYVPREDSFLLAKFVEKYAFGKVLDMGTGSGIQAESALKNKAVEDFTSTALFHLSYSLIMSTRTLKCSIMNIKLSAERSFTISGWKNNFSGYLNSVE